MSFSFLMLWISTFMTFISHCQILTIHLTPVCKTVVTQNFSQIHSLQIFHDPAISSHWLFKYVLHCVLADTIYLNKNRPFRKFWPFCFKRYTNCQVFAVKRVKKLMLKKQLNFKIVEDRWILNNFWANCSNLKWLKKCDKFAMANITSNILEASYY